MYNTQSIMTANLHTKGVFKLLCWFWPIGVFSPLLRFVLCFQLAFYPVYSFPQPPTGGPPSSPEGPADLNQNLKPHFLKGQVGAVDEFNQKVESLTEHIFGPRTSSEHYKSHPLDFYSLIHQKVEQNTAGFWERHNPYYKETKAIFTHFGREKKTKESPIESAEEQILSFFDTGENINQEEQKEERQHNKNGQDEEEKPAEEEPKKGAPQPRPFFAEIHPEKLVVNISQVLSTDSETPEKQIVLKQINMQGHKINRLYQNRETYAGRGSLVPDTEKLYSFNISYQGQVLHRFSNNIQWISFLGPYLVFMEPSRIYEKKAELSFIDLAYFHQAIGKTALPVFHIPIALKSKKQRSALFHPQSIDIRSDSLILTSKEGHTETITQKQISELSHIQQVSFNVLVSMLSAERYERDMLPFLEEIAKTLESTLREQEKRSAENNTTDFLKSKAILRRVTAEILKNRVDLGNPSHHTGHYGALKAAQHRIKAVMDSRSALLSAITKAEEAIKAGVEQDPETERILQESRQKLAQLNISDLDLETYHKSVQHLEQDQQFQQAIGELKSAKFGRRQLGDRLKALWVYLTLPQPLGAPKIQEALGLIAGSVRKTETVEDRFLMFEEGLKQVMAHPKTRIVGLAVITGMAGFVAPEVASFFKDIFNFTGRSMGVWGVALGDMMTKYLPAFINPADWSRAYVQEGRLGPTVLGVSSIMTASILAYYVFHFPVNLKKFIDYLRTKKQSHHQKEARFYTKHLFSLSSFRDFIQQTERQYYRDLSVGEFKKLGLPVGFVFPNGNKIDSVLKTAERVSSIMGDYKNPDFALHFRVNINEGEESLLFSTERKRHQKPAFTLDIIPHPEERSQRTFFLKEGYLSDMFKDGQLVDNVSFELTGERGEDHTAFLYKGFLKRMSFTAEEMENLQSALTGTRYQKIYDTFLIDPLSRKAEQIAGQEVIREMSSLEKINNKIKKLSTNLKALRMFILSTPTFNNTQSFLNNVWNNWFLLRSLWYNVFYPHRLATLMFLPNYLRIIYGEKHTPTPYNGGNRLLFKNLAKKLYPSGREYLSALKEFEKQIIPVERMYLTASAKHAYLVALQSSLKEGENYGALLSAGLQKRTGNFEFLPTDEMADKQISELDFRDPRVSESYQAIISSTSQSKDSLNRKQSFYIELVQNRLFEESMRAYIKEQYGLTGDMGDRQILRQIQDSMRRENFPELRVEDMHEVQNRVRTIAREKNVAQSIKNNIESWHKGLLEKLSVKHKKVMKNMLNPYKNLQMERYHVSKIMGKDTEAMARASRYAGVRLLIDKPLELSILLLMMAGITSSILKPLYSEPFSERAFFYMSVYLFWVGFFGGYMIEMMAATWDKLQTDAKLAFSNAFGRLPEKADLEKRFSALRYFAKNSHNIGKQDPELKENTIWERYKYGWRVILSNIPASIPTMLIMMLPFMGRFDMEAYIGGYVLFILLPILATSFKIEGIYEISAGYAARHLMRLGVDVKKFLHHPVIQQILLKDAFKDRIRFNLLNALTFDNLVGNGTTIMENVSAFPGSRVIHRAFFSEAHIVTEYWDKLTEHASNMFSGVSDFCKKVFTNRRLDDPMD